MFGDILSWYLTSLVEFWGSAVRIGLPQILLVILLICWLRRKGCGRACCRIRSCDRFGDKAERTCREAATGRGRAAGQRHSGMQDHAREVGGDDGDE